MLTENNILKYLWAKSDESGTQNILAHLINAGVVAQELLRNSSINCVLEYLKENLGEDTDNTINFIAYIVAMHDIGKIHPLFQCKNGETHRILTELGMAQEDNTSGNFRHELYSSEIMKKYLTDKGCRGRYNRYISHILARHHEGRVGKNKEIRPSIVGEWTKLQDLTEEVLNKVFKFDMVDLENAKNIDGVCMIILGIVILSDWIASDYYFSESSKKEDLSLEEYVNWAKLTAKKALKRSGLEKEEGLKTEYTYKDMWGYDESNLRPIQKECMKIFDNEQADLIIIEAAMGEGKTEAALYAASKMADNKRGIYVALPTSATSNQMYNRVNKLFKNIGLGHVRLIHSMSWLVEEKNSNSEVDSWLTPTRRGLLGNNSVGTIDQAMMSVMNIKYSILRLIGLTGKVLILDEVHAYDSYMSSILEILLNWCSILDIPVIMLSATLPQNKREKYVQAYLGEEYKSENTGYPLITTCNKSLKYVNEISVESHINRKVKIDLNEELGKYSEIPKLIENVNEQGGCVAIILNTVNGAQKLYQEIRGKVAKDVDLILIHARMPSDRRAELERDIELKFKGNANRPKKSIVIGTQVLEQSLDVDFDWIITEIAPIDLVLQRMGRVHRHEDTVRPEWLKDPKVTILVPCEGKTFGVSRFIYPEFILGETLEVIKSIENINIPLDMRNLIESVYNSRVLGEDMDKLEKFFEYMSENNNKEIHGKLVTLNPPQEDKFGLCSSTHLVYDEDTQEGSKIVARTRLGEPSQRVVFIEEEIIDNLDLSERSTAEYILSKSMNLPLRNIRRTPYKGFRGVIECKGILKGTLIFPMINGEYLVEDEKIEGYELDNKLGLIIKKKGKR